MRKFKPNYDYSTRSSDRFGERCLYIVKYDEDFAYTEAYLSPEFLREYGIGREFEIEPLKSSGRLRAFLIEQWGKYSLILVDNTDGVFLINIDDLDDTDRMVDILFRCYKALKSLTEVDPASPGGCTKALLVFDNLDIWGNVTTDNWAFHVVGEAQNGNFHLVGVKNGEFVDMLHLRNWLYFLVKKYKQMI